MENTNANIPVHAAQADSVLSACGMTHVAQTPLLGDVTCPECLDAMVKKMAAIQLVYPKSPDYCKCCGVLFEDVHASGNVRSSYNHLVCVPCWNSQDFQEWADATLLISTKVL